MGLPQGTVAVSIQCLVEDNDLGYMYYHATYPIPTYKDL